MAGLAHNLIHKKCAELRQATVFIHCKATCQACLIFAQNKIQHMNQGLSIKVCALRTILSTEYV